MIDFKAFRGTVRSINDLTESSCGEAGCCKFVSVADRAGNTVNFVVSPSTYFVDQEMISVGDPVTGYYDGNAPAILIYPPQYPALIMVKENPRQNVKVDFFNKKLISSDGQLELNISPRTRKLLTNGQAFTDNPANRNLIVIYGRTTRSIPAQTTPYRIIIWC